MRMSALFGEKNLPNFSNFMVCSHGQGEEGSIFAILCGRLLWTVPYLICLAKNIFISLLDKQLYHNHKRESILNL